MSVTLEVLRGATDEIRERAVHLVDSGAGQIECLPAGPGFRVEVSLATANHTTRCVLAGGHTVVERIERDGEVIFAAPTTESASEGLAYRMALKPLGVADLLTLAEQLDDEDLEGAAGGVSSGFKQHASVGAKFASIVAAKISAGGGMSGMGMSSGVLVKKR